jgi:hypothetical protein
MRLIIVVYGLLLLSNFGYSQNEECPLEIGINLAGAADYGSEWPFVNIYKYSRNWITHNHPDWTGGVPWDPWSTELHEQIPMNEFGYPTHVPFEVPGADTVQVVRTVWANTFQLPAGEYILLYDGEGVIDFWGDAQIIEASPGRISVQVTPDGGLMAMELYESNVDNPVRNIRFLLPGTEETYQEQPWTSEWIDKLEPFKTIRFMDWGGTNGSPLRHWEDRPQVDDFIYTLDGIPYEWWVEICNANQSDAWICVPHLADENYITELATLFRDGLDPDLKIYVEYSNELWNWIFPQAHYGLDSLDQNLAWPERLGPKIADVMQIWTDVFGEDNDRLVRVLATQNGWFDIGNRILQQIQADGNGHLIDALSPSGYMYYYTEPIAALGADATAADVLEQARALSFNENDWLMQSWRQHADLAEANDLQLLFYEAGEHFTPEPWGTVQDYNTALQNAHIDPGMYDLYAELLDTLANLTTGQEVFMHFSFITPPPDEDPNQGAYGNFGSLSSQFYQFEPYEDAPKYRVLTDYLNDCLVSSTVEENISNSIKLFPNPANDRVLVEVDPILIGENWTLFNALGQAVQHGTIQSTQNWLDIQNLPKGMYLIKLENAITLSLIKQ